MAKLSIVEVERCKAYLEYCEILVMNLEKKIDELGFDNEAIDINIRSNYISIIDAIKKSMVDMYCFEHDINTKDMFGGEKYIPCYPTDPFNPPQVIPLYGQKWFDTNPTCTTNVQYNQNNKDNK